VEEVKKEKDATCIMPGMFSRISAGSVMAAVCPDSMSKKITIVALFVIACCLIPRIQRWLALTPPISCDISTAAEDIVVWPSKSTSGFKLAPQFDVYLYRLDEAIFQELAAAEKQAKTPPWLHDFQLALHAASFGSESAPAINITVKDPTLETVTIRPGYYVVYSHPNLNCGLDVGWSLWQVKKSDSLRYPAVQWLQQWEDTTQGTGVR
jgi:hypothetical protein